MSGPPRERLRILGLLVAGSALALLLAEAAVRATGQPDVVVLAYCVNDVQGMESNLVDRLRAEAEQRVPAGARLTRFEPLDLSPAFQRCAAEGPVAIDTLHPNEHGHRCTA